MPTTLIKISLEGSLKEKYGSPFHMAINSPAEAIRALCSQLKGFRDEFNAGNFQVFRENDGAKEVINGKNCDVGISNDEIIISPMIAGRGGSISFGGASFTPLDLIAPLVTIPLKIAQDIIEPYFKVATPGYDKRTPANQRSSFIFNGPANVSAQGIAIPLVYGLMRTGSRVISQGIISEEV